MEKRFDEGFDNILVADYDKEYEGGYTINADTLVVGTERKKVSLNGEWHFAPDVFCSNIRSRWFDETKYNRNQEPIPYDADFENWDTIAVPGVWNNARREYALYEGAGVYYKQFDFDISREKGVRYILKIGAANYETRIWLNKTYLGRHLGGFTPFCVDVTQNLQQENSLLIMVNNTRKMEQVPTLHYDWFNYGGIFRDVEILVVPELHIQNSYIQLSKVKENSLEYWIRVKDIQKRAENLAWIEIKELDIHKEVRCLYMGKENLNGEEYYLYETKGSISINESQLQKWSPDSPKCYLVKMVCGEDQVEELIGFRRVNVNGRHIYLNGKEIFLKGICAHDEHPHALRSQSEEEIRHMFQEVKELGCNFMRLAHYPHSEMVARVADQMGILLLEEIPVYWAIAFRNPATVVDAQNQLRELILRDCNRASVIIWSIGNENPDSDDRYQFMKTLAQTAREIDSTRLICAACLFDVDKKQIKDRLISELDIVGINEYYGWYIKDFETLPMILNSYKDDKPILITEMGADAKSGYHSSSMEIFSEELQAEIYRKQFRVLLNTPAVRGICPWILYDFASMRRMSSIQNGYNLKGIISSDRTHKKMAYDVVYEVYHNR